ncbi:MAG: N-acetyl-gamma-glutamyl-phosphate reductase [Clostridiales Family XIII bacterium]|nr:N-acetyl-gamma-glutamyl-phosphate reductase [Clostridiales Family XIII bacterium]
MYKIFIDGNVGTTGLKLASRLSSRDDIELVEIPNEMRKDVQTRMGAILEADITFLCLPDEGSKEIVNAIMAEYAIYGEKSRFTGVRIIDCSTAHRTYPNWAYGMPELFTNRNADTSEVGVNMFSGKSDLVAVPGCHATGFIITVRPLIEAGLLKREDLVSFHSITGYSGGGKKMIEAYEEALSAVGADKQNFLAAPRQYGLTQFHKHLPEMTKFSGLNKAPIFSPIVASYYSGMLVSVPIEIGALQKKVSVADIHDVFAEYYRDCPLICLRPLGADPEAGFLSAYKMSGRDDLEILIEGNDERIDIITRYDNLGKGASGAAIQCMNIMLGLPEVKGLITGE